MTGSLDQQLAQLALSYVELSTRLISNQDVGCPLTESSRMSCNISHGLLSLSVVCVKRQITALVHPDRVSQELRTDELSSCDATYMLLTRGRKDWGRPGRVVRVELNVEELGQVYVTC